METKTMILPEDLVSTIEDYARKYHLSPADFVRLSIEKYVHYPEVKAIEIAKDLLLNDPEALRAIYLDAADEDVKLALYGIEHYTRLLQEEEECYK